MNNNVRRITTVVLTVIGIFIAVNRIFLLGLLKIIQIENSYWYLLLGIFGGLSFILYSGKAKKTEDGPISVSWYDVVLMVVLLGSCIYFSAHGTDIVLKGWDWTAPLIPTILSFAVWLLILEAVRRVSGWPLAIICLVFSLFPLFADKCPGFLQGQSYTLTQISPIHIMSATGVLGIPLQVFAGLLVGFLVFGVALSSTGGGKFFIDLAFSLLGFTRGGPAKVSIFASALFGSISGSVVSNVVTTGSITIPAMKKTGYPAFYAGAVEACASTGGVLMPPIMGATAFIIAIFLNIPYLQVALAALIPSVLYYLCIFIQVDAFAAKTGMKGLSRSDIPRVSLTLKQGWPYLMGLSALIFFLFLRRESQGPFIATALILTVAMFRKSTRFTLKSFTDFIIDSGKILAMLVAILAGIGFIMGSLSITGVGASFATEIVYLAGNNVPLLLILGAITSLILGTGMTITACYIFLSIVLAPALVNLGLNALAVHLFIMYWGMISFITPPVALGSYAAAGIAGAGVGKTSSQAMKLGVAIFLLPFFFVLQPALIMQGKIQEIILAIFTSVIGISALGWGVEGYLLGVGKINKIIRVTLIISGLLMVIPEFKTDLFGVFIFSLVYVITFLAQRKKTRIEIIHNTINVIDTKM